MTNSYSDIYSEKEHSYFRNVRYEVLPYLPQTQYSVLEIGCGEGATLRYLKEHCGAAWTGGIEIYQPAATIAAQHLNWIYSGDIEAPLAIRPDRKVDVLLFLDVLEHLRDPWTVLSKLTRELLKPGGIVLVTLPNIRNLRVVGRLLFFGDWHYEDAGILDRTHLRFFTYRTGLELMRQAGLTDIVGAPLISKRLRLAAEVFRITGTDGLVASQILYRAHLPT